MTANTRKLKIVLADDEKFIARAYSEGLSRVGYEIILANDGVTALEKIRENTPDLVLLGLIMPGMTGFEVLKAIKEDPKISNTTVVILSNLSQETDKEEVLRLGAKDFIIKSDLSLQELIDKVKSILS